MINVGSVSAVRRAGRFPSFIGRRLCCRCFQETGAVAAARFRNSIFSPLTHGMASSSRPVLRFADVGANLTDPIFHGFYRGHSKPVHPDDLADIIDRARSVGCIKLMVTGSDLEESKKAVEIAKAYPGTCYATVGVHPCATKSFDSENGDSSCILSGLKALAASEAASGHVVAFGEIGLDYDRLTFADRETQRRYFSAQLEVAASLPEHLQLPLFLHSRAAAADFEQLLQPYLARLKRGGLVHSFTGSLEEMHRLLDLGLDIGINGCSLKTPENLEVVKALPLGRLHLETDAPWCEIRPSSAGYKFLQAAEAEAGGKDGAVTVQWKRVKKEKWEKGAMVKGRNEPCTIPEVAVVVAAVKGISVQEVCEAAWKNSISMFGLGEVNGDIYTKK